MLWLDLLPLSAGKNRQWKRATGWWTRIILGWAWLENEMISYQWYQCHQRQTLGVDWRAAAVLVDADLMYHLQSLTWKIAAPAKPY
jgi:hypothetical protein